MSNTNPSRRKKSKWWIVLLIVVPSVVGLGIALNNQGLLDALGPFNPFNALPGKPPVDSGPQMVERVNFWRAQAGLPPVTLNPDYADGCRKHVNYLHLNRNNPKAQEMNVHKEFSGLPGYSQEGLNAAGSSVIAFCLNNAMV